MEKKLKLKNGKTVVVRELQANEDVFSLTRFINELVEEKAFILMGELMTPEGEADWLRGKVKENERGDTMDWRIFLDGKLVGGLEARRMKMKRRDSVEFGIALSKEVRGQGLGRQLLTMIIAEAKRVWKPHRMFICALGKNERAIRLYESLGFREVARIPELNNHFGEYMDEVWLMMEGVK
jgi:RimJ/RimL family protein N-acetyltransferase